MTGILIRLGIVGILIGVFSCQILKSEIKAQSVAPTSVVGVVKLGWDLGKKLGRVYGDILRADQKTPRNDKPCDNCANNDHEGG